MKKRFMSFIAAISLVAFAPTNAFASGWPVFDVSGWLTAMDQLYQAYDMVNNTITQIENQYKQIQKAVEAAKSIDWENIRFDGDFDIRNDIKDASKRVNRLLTQARNIKQTITTPSINCGNVKYSIADLCGATSSDRWETQKNLFTAITDYKYYMTSTMKEAVDSVVKGLTPEQKEAIWTKYGISPSNYVFIQQSQSAVTDAASTIMSKLTDKAKEMETTATENEKNAIISAADQTRDSDGNITEGAANEATVRLTGMLVSTMSDMKIAMYTCSNLAAAKAVQEENQKLVEVAEQAEWEAKNKSKEDHISSRARR